MELSKVERWLLASKFEELAKDESFTNQERKDYKKYAKVLWSGYKREYKQALDFLGLPDPLPNEKCQKVVRILEMYEAIQLSFNNLENPSISKDNILFLGFDDAVLSGYARYLVEQKQELTPIKTDDGFIGHLPMIEHYNKMLEKWEDIESKKKLSEKEIKQLLKAGLSNFFGL